MAETAHRSKWRVEMRPFAAFLTGFSPIAARIAVALPIMTISSTSLAAIALTALPFSILPVGPAMADQKDSRLMPLFDALQKAASPEEAQTIEAIIWAIWAQTGNRELDMLLVEGSMAMSNDDYDTALRDFSELVKRAPNFAEGWNKRATLYFLMGNYMASLADIDRTLALEPRHFGALAGLGLINLQMQRDQAALDAFQRVLKIDPMNAAARTNAELVKHRLGDEAI
ncbi:tetratricopeptide repeat protein [Dongia soli]|uniref:Tetratricopeptide repeat protein n=1 Tax=Dongia soli TaxID=600628 RepID=A0ABU5EFL5_9PROT|nr:tetratricopeptide repeat protein [Dongia soli]MDY0884634.1 tetratricopeptide repeat protein [Dongia soli]